MILAANEFDLIPKIQPQINDLAKLPFLTRKINDLNM